jgi:hypothetical protein
MRARGSRNLTPQPSCGSADDALLRQAAELLGETMYVAAARARDELVVTWEGEGSEFLHSSLVREP